MERVKEFIKTLNISLEEPVIVACSGGPDSMLLLYILNDLGYKVVCAHVNHKTRLETDDEYKFVKNFCDINNIIFEGIELNEKYETNFEMNARTFRYNFFESLINKYNSNYLFTAHHGDDLIETVMMRLVRGSSLKGYRGFDLISKRGTYNIVRPLIYLTKNDIFNYLDELKLDYVVDSSNSSDDYTRNRYRHHLVPFLKEECSDVHLRFIKYNETLKDTYDYISRVVYSFLDNNYKDNKLNIIEFIKLDYYIQIKVLEEIFRILFVDNLYLINNNHVNKVLEIINSNKPNIKVKLVDNLVVIKSYDFIEFDLFGFDNNPYKIELIEKIDLKLGTISIVDESTTNSNFEIRLNSKDIKLPLYIRSRLDGDRIQIKNMDGSKKVNDIFIDSKIPVTDRDVYPLLVDSDDNILWVPGLKKSNFDIPFNGVYDIIVRYEKGEKIYE